MAIELIDFHIDYPDDATRKHQRRGVRVHLPGLTAWVLERDAVFSITDLSTFGLAFNDATTSFQVGQEMHVDVHVHGKVWIAGLEAKVVAVRDGALVACAFPNMTRFQELRMDKLILEIQKRWIKIRKQQTQQDGDEANANKT
ncbi:MAG: PilZ domain-containing protein [Desulfovibrionales bacterium]|nr:MAG: PilZ domain-containing protein [Desulfovibrionales bacterium]